MNRIVSSFLVVAALAVPAIAAADVHVYTRVNQIATDDGYSYEWYSSLDISGVRADGERTSSYRIYSDAPDRKSRTFEACQKYAAMTLAKPGRYVLEVRYTLNRNENLLTGCSLRRVEPEVRQ